MFLINYKNHSGRTAKNDACGSYILIEILKLEKALYTTCGVAQILSGLSL
jgi:hypothetical protein